MDEGKKKDDSLKEMLRAAIDEEAGDFAFYNEMANMVKNRVLKSILLGIAGDEYGHARTWRAVLELFDCVETK